jgi:Fe-S-cluster-containing hydrogenase component 2
VACAVCPFHEIFSKEKTEKKKADNYCGQKQKPKGNGIMEGCPLGK